MSPATVLIGALGLILHTGDEFSKKKVLRKQDLTFDTDTCPYFLRKKNENISKCHLLISLFNTKFLFVCVEVLRPSQPSWVMWCMVSLPNHTFTGQA